MAISLKTAGTWARIVADPSTVTIPGTPAAGDRMFLFVSWKTFDITVANPAGWTSLGSFSDGAVAAGNGTGSVTNQIWYRDWQSGDANPSVDWSAAPTEGHAVVMLWTKAGGDTWGTPLVRTGAIAAADPFTVNASATITVKNGSVVMCLIGLRDDSTGMVRATDAIDDTGALVTWNGNYVESPATHFNSTTGLDMSGDLGHRLVTTGAAGVTLHADGDPTAAETGSAMFIMQALADPILVTPGLLALVTAAFTPVVNVGVLVTPGVLALTTTRFTPTVLTPRLVTPGVLALTTTRFTPTVLAPRLVTPGVLALTLTPFAPTVTAGAGGPVLVTPGLLALTLSLLAPTVTVSGGAPAPEPYHIWSGRLSQEATVGSRAAARLKRNLKGRADFLAAQREYEDALDDLLAEARALLQ
jgi:hypothetical protein